MSSTEVTEFISDGQLVNRLTKMLKIVIEVLKFKKFTRLKLKSPKIVLNPKKTKITISQKQKSMAHRFTLNVSELFENWPRT